MGDECTFLELTVDWYQKKKILKMVGRDVGFNFTIGGSKKNLSTQLPIKKEKWDYWPASKRVPKSGRRETASSGAKAQSRIGLRVKGNNHGDGVKSPRKRHLK